MGPDTEITPGVIVTGVWLATAVEPPFRVAATTPPASAPAPATARTTHHPDFFERASDPVGELTCAITMLPVLFSFVAVALMLNRPSWSFGT